MMKVEVFLLISGATWHDAGSDKFYFEKSRKS